jgi:parafibromin
MTLPTFHRQHTTTTTTTTTTTKPTASASASMADQDVLDLLRGAIAASTSVTLADASGTAVDSLASATVLVFPGDIKVSKDAASRYTRSATSSETYTAGQLWQAWTERDTAIREYLVKGQAAGGFVAITDRRDVVLFLQGGESARVLGKGEAGEWNR